MTSQTLDKPVQTNAATTPRESLRHLIHTGKGLAEALSKHTDASPECGEVLLLLETTLESALCALRRLEGGGLSGAG